jgi:hypothetical protein
VGPSTLLLLLLLLPLLLLLLLLLSLLLLPLLLLPLLLPVSRPLPEWWPQSAARSSSCWALVS